MVKKIILGVVLVFCYQTIFAVNDTFVYYLKYTNRYKDDVVVYCGITNDPEARALEHVYGGTMKYNTFDTMVVFEGPMSRHQAFQEETACIRRYDIPRMYQLPPLDYSAIEEYESHYDASRLVQTLDPTVVYTPTVRKALGMAKVCEDCGESVTKGIIDYSRRNFDGHTFCMDCQSGHR